MPTAPVPPGPLMGGPTRTAPGPMQFLGAQPGSSGLAPWLRQGTSPLQAQANMGQMVRSPTQNPNVPWYQSQLDEQAKQAELLKQQQLQKQQADAAAAAAAAAAQQEQQFQHPSDATGGSFGTGD